MRKTYLFGLFLVCYLPTANSAEPVILDAQLKKLWVEVLAPVLAGREAFVQVRQVPDPSRKPTLLLQSVAPLSRDLSVPLAEYRIHWDSSASLNTATVLTLKKAEAASRAIRKTIPLVVGEISFDPTALNADNLRRSQGHFRSLLRADPLLHPQIIPVMPGAQFHLSQPQVEVLDQLQAYEAKARTDKQALRALVLLPTGMGKTYVAIKYVERQWQTNEWHDQKVIFVLQDRAVLKEAGERFAKVLKLQQGSEIFIQPNMSAAESKLAFSNPRTRVWFVTRSFAHANLNKIKELYRNHSVCLTLDEAQHLGRHLEGPNELEEDEVPQSGQFQEILKELNPLLKPSDQILGLTATPWHQQSNLLETIFHNNVATAFLSPDELQGYLKRRDYLNLARIVMLRAMAEGYLSPIHSYEQVRYFDDGSDVAPFLNDSELVTSSGDIVSRRREVKIHLPLVKHMVRNIQEKTRTEGYGLLTYVRGMIFVPTIAHAEEYSNLLNREAKVRGMNTFFKSYHSKIEADKYRDLNADEMRERVLDWFQDLDPKVDMHVHKYLIVVNSLGEGADFPAVNHLVLARPYNDVDVVGMRLLMQHLGRLARASSSKNMSWITDYSGRMYDLLFKDLDPRLRDEVLLQPFTPAPTASGVVVVEAVVDETSMVAQGLDTNVVDATPALENAQPPAPSKKKGRLLVGESFDKDSRDLVSMGGVGPYYDHLVFGDDGVAFETLRLRYIEKPDKAVEMAKESGVPDTPRFLSEVFDRSNWLTEEDIAKINSTKDKVHFFVKDGRLQSQSGEILDFANVDAFFFAGEILNHRKHKLQGKKDVLANMEVGDLASLLGLVRKTTLGQSITLPSWMIDYDGFDFYRHQLFDRHKTVGTYFGLEEVEVVVGDIDFNVWRSYSFGDLNAKAFHRNFHQQWVRRTAGIRREFVPVKNLAEILSSLTNLRGFSGLTASTLKILDPADLAGAPSPIELFHMNLADWPQVAGGQKEKGIKFDWEALAEIWGIHTLRDFYRFIQPENLVKHIKLVNEGGSEKASMARRFYSRHREPNFSEVLSALFFAETAESVRQKSGSSKAKRFAWSTASFFVPTEPMRSDEYRRLFHQRIEVTAKFELLLTRLAFLRLPMVGDKNRSQFINDCDALLKKDKPSLGLF